MLLFYGMLYPGLFVWIVWMAILCGVVPMNFFNSTAFQGWVLFRLQQSWTGAGHGEHKGRRFVRF